MSAPESDYYGTSCPYCGVTLDLDTGVAATRSMMHGQFSKIICCPECAKKHKETNA